MIHKDRLQKLLCGFLICVVPNAYAGNNYYVTAAGPTGSGSLANVIATANADASATAASPHRIYFNVSNLPDYLTSGQKCLWVSSTIIIRRPMIIDGRYQGVNTLLSGASLENFAKPRVLIRGSGNYQNNPDHIFNIRANNTSIMGFQIYGFKYTGIYVGVAGGTISVNNGYFANNRIGFLDLGYNQGGIWLNWELNPSELNPDATRDIHLQANGIEIQGDDNTIKYNIIGGVHNGIGVSKDAGIAQRNVITNNWVGVMMRPDGMTSITRNLTYPPTPQATQYQKAGNGDFGFRAQWNGYSLNSDGIYIDNAQNTLIENNITSGCFSAGIELWDSSAKNNIIRNNISGSDSTKTRGLANGEYGIVIGNGASNNSIYYNNAVSNKYGGIGLFNYGTEWGYITGNYITDNYCGVSDIGAYFYQTGTSNLIQGRGIYLYTSHPNDVTGNVVRWNRISNGNQVSIQNNTGSLNTVDSNY